MSKVDILIPAYNAAHFLPHALESVLAQTEQDWRILLVDDGSTDNTREVIEAFQRENAGRLRGRLTYVFQSNRGLPAARNTGIRNSSSPFLALLDADDLWLPNRLADSLSSFDGKPSAGLSYSGFSRVDESGKVLDTFTTSDMGGPGEMASRIYRRDVHLPCPTVTFRRACVEQVGLFDESLRASEDRDLWLRIAQRYDVVFVPKELALYRISASSMSGDLPRMLLAQQQVIRKHYGSPGCGWTDRRAALANSYLQQALGYAARGQRGPAARFALQAIGMTPLRKGIVVVALRTLLQTLRA